MPIVLAVTQEYGSEGKGATDRARVSHVLSKLLARLESNQGSWVTSIVGPRLDVDSGGTVVDDNGLVGGGSATDHGGESGKDAELHVGEYVW